MVEDSEDVWEKSWTAEQPLFKHEAQIEQLIKCRFIIGNVARSSLFFSENGRAQRWITKRGVHDAEEDGKKLLNPLIARKTLKDIKSTIKEFWSLTGKLRDILAKNISIHSSAFVRVFKKYSNVTLTVFAYILTTWEPTSHALEQQLSSIVESRMPGKVRDVIATLTTPCVQDLLLREKISLFNLIKNPTKRKIQQHMVRFSFLFTNIDSKKDAEELMDRRLGAESAAKLKNEINISRKRLKKLKTIQEQLSRKLKSSEAKRIAQLIQQLTILRLELKNCWSGIHYSLFGLFERIAKETHMSIRDVMMFWSMKDIFSFLKDRVAVTSHEIQNRKDFYLIYVNGKEGGFYSGRGARKLKYRILGQATQTDLKTFTGNIANGGKVMGVVRVIDFDDLRIIEKTAQTIKEPFVLVTGMTNPNMIPLIKKAKAIVTDEGGITCHAAIISREFDIPCVIGTKIATQVLKDGDLVEVDANAGVVKKVK